MSLNTHRSIKSKLFTGFSRHQSKLARCVLPVFVMILTYTMVTLIFVRGPLQNHVDDQMDKQPSEKVRHRHVERSTSEKMKSKHFKRENHSETPNKTSFKSHKSFHNSFDSINVTKMDHLQMNILVLSYMK